ncbi:MAG: tyrosine-type recombinase/integrase, partial [Oscillospiraceae bacterium]|nr:tyrosine-type recombinase/integrase [Oscillospiraceae bacterium]
YRYIYAKTYKEVREKKIKYWDKSLENSDVSSVAEAQKASDLFKLWLSNDVSGRVKPSTYENYYYCINKYVIPTFNSLGADRITELSVEQLVKSVNSNERLSQVYKRKLLSIFKTALKDILKNNPNSSSIIAMVKLPPKDNTEVQVFSIKEQRRIENVVLNSEDDRLLGILLSFYTGIRLGELCSLKWGDFDFEAGIMSVSRTVGRTENFNTGEGKTSLLVGSPKSQKSLRKIPVPSFLLEIVKERKLMQYCESHYILTKTECPFDPRTYQKLYKQVLNKAGVKERKFHTIRHTFATRALELGVDIKTLSEILGHSTVSITLNTYAHSLFEQKRLAINKLNEMYLNNMEVASLAVVFPVNVLV